MRRRTCIVSGTLLACSVRAAPSADDFEGRWLAVSGPPDNRAHIGLELTRGPDSALRARYTIDVMNFYGAALPPLEAGADGRWGLPLYGLSIARNVGGLQVTGLADEPLQMHRVASLPQPPERPMPARGPAPVWQLRLGGPIFAAAATHGHHAYLGNTDGVMAAIDARDGTLAWTFAAGRAIHGEATVTDDAVYFVCDNGWLYRLERATGKEVWRYDLGDARVPRVLPNPFVFDYDHAAPRPVLHDGVLYVGAGDGGFHAVSADQGTRRWRFAASGKVRASAAVHDDWVVFGTLANAVHGLDRESGRERWRNDTEGPVTGAPTFAGAHVIVGDRGSRLRLLQPGRDQPLWNQSWWGSWVESTAIVRDDTGYIGSGDLFLVSAFDVATGRHRWRSHVGGWVLQRPLVTDRWVHASVSGARRRAAHFLPQRSGLVKIDRRDGRIAWHWAAPPASPGAFLFGLVAAPAWVDGRVLVGLDGSLYAFEDGPD
jgi:outer membrane protein assembly factor BamB